MNSDKTNKEQLEKYNSIHKIDNNEKKKVFKLIKVFKDLLMISIILLFILAVNGKIDFIVIEIYIALITIITGIIFLPRNKQKDIIKKTIIGLFDILIYIAIGIIFVLAILAILSYFLKKI